MANHVYFNIEIDGLSEEQHNCLFKTEITTRPHWDEGKPPIEYQELVEIHEQPFMSNVERTYGEDGWLDDSYNWYCREVGAKWCNIDEWDYGMITGYSAWSTPYQMVCHMLEYASKRFGLELSARMTYEDEFRNFIGRDFFETYHTDEGFYCSHSEESIDGSELNELLEENLGCEVSSDDFEWFEEYKDTGLVPSECVDEMVYNFFETGELHWVS